MFPSNQESLPQIYPRDPLHPSLSSSLVRLNQWHNNRLSHTLEELVHQPYSCHRTLLLPM